MIISELKGVGPKKAKTLAKMSVKTGEDLLYIFPRDYEDRRKVTPLSELEPETVALTKGLVKMVLKSGFGRRRKQIIKLLVEDGTSKMEVVFFNAAYLANTVKKEEEYYFYGTPKLNMGKLQMIHPEFSKNNDSASIIPVYPLTSGIGQIEMRKLQKQAVNLADKIEDYLPTDVIQSAKLCSLAQALRWIHFPKTMKELKIAKYKLIYDELFVLQTGLIMMKHRDDEGIQMTASGVENEYIASMSFSFTGAQKRVVKEICSDMASGKAMNRLIQGDVGSGKTAVAEVALYKAVKSGYQGALMAPTEILAKQHYQGLKMRFEPFGITVGCLSGSMSAIDKQKVLKDLKSGHIDILIGTHAMIQPGVNFLKLGLVITDEQHRFGVGQRLMLTQKGDNPDILVMTATPIPRTVAVVLYGDLDVSIIDELPPGRKKILTKAVTGKVRDKVYKFVAEELDKGKQAYVVAPLIGESEFIEARSAEEIFEELSKRFYNKQVALIHGEIKAGEKEQIMELFSKGKIDVLVATVVIEVGINVPNATIMVIENGERFGLAQLHQLRGRVGRGDSQSYCIIITQGTGEIAMERAKTMTESNDGFFIAEKDLELRGPGEIFGTRQHGLPDMHIADLVKHINIMELVRDKAMKLIEKDPELKNEKELKQRVIMAFGGNIKIIM